MSSLHQLTISVVFIFSASLRFVSSPVLLHDGPGRDTTAPSAYDQSKDGMLVAPQFTRKLGDTLGIHFYEVTVKPGDSIPWHMHPDHIFYVVDGGKAAIYFEGAGRQEWELQPGMGFVHGPVMDAARNIGNTTIKFIVADIYRPKEQ